MTIFTIFVYFYCMCVNLCIFTVFVCLFLLHLCDCTVTVFLLYLCDCIVTVFVIAVLLQLSVVLYCICEFSFVDNNSYQQLSLALTKKSTQ